MPGIYDAPSAVKGVFALDVVTACLAFILLALNITIIVTRRVNGRARSFTHIRRSSDGAPLRTTLATHLFLAPALLCLTIAYAIQSAVVALDAKVRAPAAITSAYAYSYADSLQAPWTTSYGKSLSILSFTFQLAAVLLTFALTGAVWLHSNNLTNNGLGVSMPGKKSKIWNTFILTCILAFGLASWALGLDMRGSGDDALTYPGTMDDPGTTRVLFVVFRIIVIIASTSVSIEVIRNYFNLKKNGAADVSSANLDVPSLLFADTRLLTTTSRLQNAHS